MALQADTDPAKSYAEGVWVTIASFGGNPLVGAVDALGSGRYPTIPSGTTVMLRGGHEVEPGGWIGDLLIPEEDGADVVLDRLAPRQYDRNCRPLMPALPGEVDVLPPFMLWWMLLFSLSIIARYHPDLWARALAVDESRLAVPLEATLQKARNVLPLLVYEAILVDGAQAREA